MTQENTYRPTFRTLTGTQSTTFFGVLPNEIIFEISKMADDEDFAKALKHVACGELNLVKAMLDVNPSLVLYAGTVVTPGGLIVENTTLLECALGAGDPEMAEMILPYFSQVKSKDKNGKEINIGETKKLEQLERYRPHIEGVFTQKPYDLRNLIEIIKKSSAADVTKALKKEMSHESELCKALEQFRKDVRPGKIKKPGMHYNYQTLIYAYDCIYEMLNKAENDNPFNFDKCILVWRQVVGYLQRGFPAVERFAFANGFYGLIYNKCPLKRDLKFTYEGAADISFPDTSSGDADFSGPGFDYCVSVFAGWRQGGRNALELLWEREWFQTYVKKKLSNLQNILAEHLSCLPTHKRECPGM